MKDEMDDMLDEAKMRLAENAARKVMPADKVQEHMDRIKRERIAYDNLTHRHGLDD